MLKQKLFFLSIRKGLQCILLLLGIMFLTGCFDVATTGAQAVYNRRSLQKNFSDQYITMQAYQALQFKSHKAFSDTNISIATFNSDVLLAGQVPHAEQKAKAQEIVKNVPGVKQIYNLLTIESPSSTLTRISDTWITAKVKSQLIASEDLDATQIKVVTENGTVYLMGILPPNEAEEAIRIASNTAGVKSVVKMFMYMRITKT